MVRRFTGPCSRLEVVGPNIQEDPTTEKSVLEALTSLDPNESADGSGRVPSLLGWPVQCIAASGRARLHSSFFRSIKIKLRNTSLLFPLTLSNIAALRAPACVKTRSLEEETHTSVFSCINIVSRKSHGPTSYRYELQPLHIHGICVPLCVCVYRDR